MKTNNTGFAPIAIVLIVVAILAVGGFAYYMGTNKPSESSSNTDSLELNSGPFLNEDTYIPPKPLISNQNTTTNNSTCTPNSTPSITVLSPNGGQTYTAGQQITVSWTTCNVASSNRDMVIGLRNGTTTINMSYALLNDGSELVTIPPSTTSGSYKINVGNASATILQDQSDSNFAVTQNSTQSQTFFVVDSGTGINVSSPMFVVGGVTYTNISTFLSYMNTLASGTNKNVNISAPGYQTMTNIQIAVPGNLNNNVINLDPVNHATNCPTQPASPNNFAICGYVSDSNHNALGGVNVSSPNASFSATTLANGWYDTEFLPTASSSCTNPFTLTFSKTGYKTLNYVLKGPYVYAGDGFNMNVSLTPGTGTEQKLDKHSMCP